ncbi:hypothetical protein [Bradyrhizobium sp. USDA 3458]|uniref:hypothetical protein n=1 Tax=Bradyrhizobium sp. USDA 3458 TaxID=2591461 RepID=UPI001144EC75|nr:hypothetical protein [Bradyrhizobium sp. USDA 3458]
MSRKHKPLLIGGIELEITGRGFRIIARPNGVREAYWYAAKRAIQAGYHPSTVRLHGDLNSVQAINAMFNRCNDLWSEMQDWLSAGEADARPVYDGTVNSLIRCYQTDTQSPFHDVRHNTQRGYASWLKALDRVAGRRRISALTGADLRTWFREVRKPAKTGGLPRERLAKAIIQIFRILLAYGCELGLADCLKLSRMIEGMEFRRENEEKKLGTPRKAPKVVMTYAQAEAIVLKGIEIGTRRSRSVALAVAAQFEFTISQIDAIGYWMPVRAVQVTDDMIIRGGKVWRPGLRFDDFEGGILDLARLKTGHAAQFDVMEYPLFQLALAAVPDDQRSGPFVTDESGDPVRYRVFYGMYRDVAEAAGVPKEVWNARARHGGGTEARASGASIEDTTDHMQKSDMEGTRRDYIAGNVEITRRVARSRVAGRKKAKGVA